MSDTSKNVSDQTSESAEKLQVSQYKSKETSQNSNKSGEITQNAIKSVETTQNLNKSGEKIQNTSTSRPHNKSRLHHPTAASQARSKPDTISKKPLLQKVPANKSSITVKKGPIKPTAQFTDTTRGKGEPTKRVQATPLNSTMIPKKSTPNNDKSSEYFDAWDASVISTVDRTVFTTCILDETALSPIDQSTIVPQAALFKATDAKKPDGSKPALIKKPLPQTGLKQKKTQVMPAGRVPATVGKVQVAKKANDTTFGDASQDGEITDEMIDHVYFRYIQSQYIEMKSEQALEETKAQCEKQVFDAWMAYEELAQEYTEKLKRVETWKTLSAMQASLKVLREKLQPIVDVMDGLKAKFGKINAGLDAVKHNLAVQGITIEDQKIAKEELENMDKLFSKFLEDTDAIDAKVDRDMDNKLEMAQEYSKLAANFAEALRLSDDCKKLLKTAEQVALQEASLRISMMQLERAEKKNMLVELEF